ncbi:MAG: SprT family zinc-dependent metalloprotease [Pseudomonadota bacterium]
MQSSAQQLALFSDKEEPGTSSGFSVRPSKRAKRLSIKVYPRGRVEVVVPARTKAADVEAFVAENQTWIDDARAAFAKIHPPEPFQLPQWIDMAAIAQRFRVQYERPSAGRSVRSRTRHNTVILSGCTQDEQECVAALKRWLTKLARKELGRRLDAVASEIGLGYDRLQVRGQRTCWGSHSSTGTISLNYCMLFLDPDAVRYLLVHELCHGKHMNHSKRFWNLVGRFEPRYKQLDKAVSDAWSRVPVWLGIN